MTNGLAVTLIMRSLWRQGTLQRLRLGLWLQLGGGGRGGPGGRQPPRGDFSTGWGPSAIAAAVALRRLRLRSLDTGSRALAAARASFHAPRGLLLLLLLPLHRLFLFLQVGCLARRWWSSVPVPSSKPRSRGCAVQGGGGSVCGRFRGFKLQSMRSRVPGS